MFCLFILKREKIKQVCNLQAALVDNFLFSGWLKFKSNYLEFQMYKDMILKQSWKLQDDIETMAGRERERERESESLRERERERES